MRPLEENFRILRVRVEAQTQFPALLVVSSAKRNDGVTFVACGLARAFAEAGQRTLLVDANTTYPGVARELALGGTIRPGRTTTELSPQNGEIPRLSVASLVTPGEGGVVGDGKLSDLFEEMRKTYSVTVVDAATLPTSSTALQLAHAADGVLFAVRLGRRVDAADYELRRIAMEQTARVLGVVSTKAKVVRREARARVSTLPISAPSEARPRLGKVVEAGR
jgi:polysaccharide biosynthesis transport protein